MLPKKAAEKAETCKVNNKTSYFTLFALYIKKRENVLI